MATFSAFGLGAVWYGPLFGTAWKEEMGFPHEGREDGKVWDGLWNGFRLGVGRRRDPSIFQGGSPIAEGTFYGFLTGFGWIAMAMGVTSLFSRNSLKMWFIDSFYFVVRITLVGVILAAWP